MCVAREEREINVLTREVRLAFWLGYREKKKKKNPCLWEDNLIILEV